MSFSERFFQSIEDAARRPLVTEAHGARLVPYTGAEMGRLVGLARGVLRGYQIETGDRVAFVAPNSARWVALDIAILAEGAISVPLYARQAANELAAMIVDAEAALVVAHDVATLEALKKHLPPHIPVVLMGEIFREGVVVSAPPSVASPDRIATIIYTSGTSGDPKGVMLSYGNIGYMLPIIADAIQSMLARRDGEDDRVFHYLPFCFAGSRMVLWMCLFRGVNITLSTDLNALVDEMKAARPNYFLNVPFLLERIRRGVGEQIAGKPAPIRLLYDKGQQAYAKVREGKGSLKDRLVYSLARRLVFKAIKAKVGPDLDCLICGSAMLAAETQRWFEMIGVPVYQVYGLTETTAICTLDRPGQAQLGKVGWAIPGMEMRLGPGQELQVKGPNIFQAYWRKEEETASVWTEDKWFRTGDQAEISPDGALTLIGRMKNLLVPSSGHNIAPEPLEEALLQLPGVEQAVVFGHERPYLVALVTGDMDAESLQEPLQALNANLPHYRRIRRLHVSTERLTPENGCLTANQKLKRPGIAAYFEADIEAMYS